MALGEELAVGVAAETALGMVLDFVRGERKKRLALWWNRVVFDPGWLEPQEVQGRIEEKLRTDPKAQDTIWQSARSLLEALSLESCEVIGSITAEYLRDNSPVDAFFRGAVRMLAELSAAELDVLKEIARLVDRLPQQRVVGQFEHGALQFYDGPSPLGVPLGLSSDPLRLFRLIKANDLGGEPSSSNGPGAFVTSRDRGTEVGFPDRSGPYSLIPDQKSFRRLAKHLGVSAQIGGRQHPTP